MDSKVWAALGACSVLLAACQTSNPERPSVNVADEVVAVDADLLHGTWICRELNPFPDQPAVVQDVTFNADGSFFSRYVAPLASQSPGLDDLEVTITANWQAVGDEIATQNMDVSTRSLGNNQQSALFGALAEQIGDLVAPQGWQGSAEVLQQSVDTVVLRGTDPSAATLECSRGS